MTADSSSNFDATPGHATLTQLGDAIALLAAANINTMMPGTVIAYHAPTGSGVDRRPAVVEVKPDFLYRRDINVEDDAEDNEEPLERSTGWQARGSFPDLVTVPVAYPGPDGMRSVGPIEVGAVGWLVFSQRSIDGWINTGGPIDPAFDYQWHHLSDAVWMPGARYGQIAEDIDPDLYRVGSADGAAGVTITTGEPVTREIAVTTQGPKATLDAVGGLNPQIKLGANAALGVARLTDDVSATASMAAFTSSTVAAIAQIAAILNAPGPVVGAPGSVTPATPPVSLGVISGASGKVSSE